MHIFLFLLKTIQSNSFLFVLRIIRFYISRGYKRPCNYSLSSFSVDRYNFAATVKLIVQKKKRLHNVQVHFPGIGHFCHRKRKCPNQPITELGNFLWILSLFFYIGCCWGQWFQRSGPSRRRASCSRRKCHNYPSTELESFLWILFNFST